MLCCITPWLQSTTIMLQYFLWVSIILVHCSCCACSLVFLSYERNWRISWTSNLSDDSRSLSGFFTAKALRLVGHIVAVLSAGKHIRIMPCSSQTKVAEATWARWYHGEANHGRVERGKSWLEQTLPPTTSRSYTNSLVVRGLLLEPVSAKRNLQFYSLTQWAQLEMVADEFVERGVSYNEQGNSELNTCRDCSQDPAPFPKCWPRCCREENPSISIPLFI